MITDPWFYAAAIPAMVLLGLSKGGLGVIGMMVVPILAIVISPVQAAGITLPILLLSDVVAVISYWRVFDARTVRLMLPAAVVGIGIGWGTAAWVTEHHIRLIVGLISVLFALNYWFRDRLRSTAHQPNAVKGTFWGIVAGFTSFVSHAGGPPYQMYVAPLRFDPRIFAGTQVILFAIINSVKVVPYFFLGQFDTQNLITSAVLLPVSIPATVAGVWVVRRFRPEAFYNFIYLAIFLVGAFLVWESASALL